MRRRRILCNLESRATYGYSKNVLLAMREFPELEPIILVTGMHLMPELGNSQELIKEDGFTIDVEVSFCPSGDNPGAWAEALGSGIIGFAAAIEKTQPEIVVVFGDRIESFGCCIAANYMGIPTAHVQAGDKSGHIDDISRMAMAKLCNIHLASCTDSVERLEKLGEQKFRIHNVGAPQLDDIVGSDFDKDNLNINGRNIDLKRPYILLVQHPLMAEREETETQISASLNACLSIGLPIIWISPNSDMGYRKILSVMDQHKGLESVTVLTNLERMSYLTILANCNVLVGNSSSGILEAPSFKVPVINIGNRQRGRMQASNILNCGNDQTEIQAALDIALKNEEFRKSCETAINLYGDGQSGNRICEILRSAPLDQNLLDKKTVY